MLYLDSKNWECTTFFHYVVLLVALSCFHHFQLLSASFSCLFSFFCFEFWLLFALGWLISFLFGMFGAFAILFGMKTCKSANSNTKSLRDNSTKMFWALECLPLGDLNLHVWVLQNLEERSNKPQPEPLLNVCGMFLLLQTSTVGNQPILVQKKWQDSDHISVFRFNLATGKLEFTGNEWPGELKTLFKATCYNYRHIVFAIIQYNTT